MTYFKPQQSSHWYNKDGAPRYDATLREARTDDLLPSVTTITKMLDKPALNTWKQNILLESAFTLTKNDDERLEDFINRVYEDYNKNTTEAAELGTYFHEQIENYIAGNIKEIAVDGYSETCKAVTQYIDNNILDAEEIYIERTIVGNGYAGKMDLVYFKNGVWNLVDWKTQNVKKLNKNGTLSIAKYPEWLWQLAAYKQAFKYETCNNDIIIKNVIVSTNKNAQGIREVTYDQDKEENALHIFLTMVDLFNLIKGL